MTQPQSYANHVRYYAPHHFVFYPVVLILMAITVWFSIDDAEHRLLWIIALIQLVLTTGVALMLRQHYALTNQNRIVRLELRFRYYVLTNKRLELLESRLSFKQLAALRFASDGELPTLVERTIHENLSPDNIKRQIRTWYPDHMRV